MSLEHKLTEKKRIKELGRSEFREEFIFSLYDHLTDVVHDISFPLSSISALESLMLSALVKINNPIYHKLRNKKIAIVEASYPYRLKPRRCLDQRGKERSYYEVMLFNRSYRVLDVKGHNSRELELRADIDRDKLTFRHNFPGESIKNIKVYQNPDYDYFYCTSLCLDKFKNSKGIAIKKTSVKGILTFGGEKYNFGVENEHKHVLIFFSDGKAYFFDLFGNMLFSALSHKERGEKEVIIKSAGIEERAKVFDIGSYVDDICFKEKVVWAQAPALYSGCGENFIVDGEMTSKTDPSRGYTPLRYHEKDKERAMIYVGKGISGNIILHFRGPYVLIYDLNGKMINAHHLKSSVSFKNLKRHDSKNLGILSIKTIKKRLKITVGAYTYLFSKPEIEKEMGRSLDDFKFKGILAYINPRLGQKYFEVLLLNEDCSFISKKVEPYDIGPSFKYS